MRVLLAGALGDLGIKVGELLTDKGHEVWGLTRSGERTRDLERRGQRGVVADLMDRSAVSDAIRKVRPEAIVSVPIALPERGPIRPRELEVTNRLRVTGTRNLLEAAVEEGVKRIVVESIVAVYGYGDVEGGVLDESGPTQRRAPLRALQPALDAIHQQEEMVLTAARSCSIDGVIVRLGFYYGSEVGSTRFMAKLLRHKVMPVAREGGAMPWVEISDGAAGVVAALERGRSGEIYNIVGDESIGLADLARELARQLGTSAPRVLPTWLIRMGGRYAAVMGATRLHVSNSKAKRELDWTPRFPTVREGVAHVVKEL